MFDRLEDYEKAAALMPGSVIIFQLMPNDVMKVLYYSRKAQEMTGMDHLEVDDTVFPDGFNMIIDDDQKIIIDKIKYAITHHEELDITYRQHHKTAGMVWIHMKAAIAGELEGLPIFIASMLDVTHEMLNSSSIMEASDRSICVIEKHSKLLLYGNSKFYELINRAPSESMGVYCYDVLCGNSAFKNDNQCLCFSTINIEKPFEYYNPDLKQYLSMYGREIMWGEHEAYVFYITDQTKEKFKEKQLKNAQEHFEMTLRNSDLYIWEYDIVNSQCINSEKAVREYGLPLVIDHYPESLYDMGYTPPETVEQLKDVKRRLLNGESGFSVERRTINAQGISQWMRVSYTLETDAGGQPVRALICGTDITEQKRKEQEYEEELRLKKTVGSDTTILAILNLTQDKTVENDALNPLLAAYLTADSIDRIGGAISAAFIAPSDRAEYMAHFSRKRMLAQYERGVVRDTYRHQLAHRAGWIESAYDLLQNPASGDIEAVLSIKDVTEEMRAQQVVKKLTSIDYEMILTVDVESGETYLFDMNAGDETNSGKTLKPNEYETYTDAYIKAHCTPAEARRVSEEASSQYVLNKLQNAAFYTFSYTMNVDGKAVRKRNFYTYLDQSHKTVLCARQDVTESYLQEEKQKRELSDALKKAEVANQAKTVFLSRVSHDMRTPLNGILGLTALMKDEAMAPEFLNDLKKLELSSKYLLDLINDVLDVSSIESGKLELHPAVCDGKIVMSNIVKLVKSTMDAKHIDFVLDDSEMAYAPIYVDEARIQQVAVNILGNAAKFTPDGGRVEFISKTLSTSGGVNVNAFIIRDNGIGMDKDFVPRLFEPFSQENASSTNTKSGTGLGMSITKRIVELMGGTIKVESEKGVGTTVTVALQFPLATEEQRKERKAAARPHSSNYHLEGKRVLICEDHPLNWEIAKRILQKVGVVVEHAEDGQSGVDMFARSPVGYYDAILMDIRMPVMDGLDASRAIRGLARTDAAAIPIIAMTANALDEDVKNVAAAGMNAHLPKPVDPMQLYRNLEKYTNKQTEANRPRILIVDDIEMDRALLTKALENEYEIFQAESGKCALDVMEKYKGIDLVITDIQMPEMDGINLIQKIRADDSLRHVGIIVYTGVHEPSQEERLLQMGVNDFMYKPSQPKVIELRVRNAIARL